MPLLLQSQGEGLSALSKASSHCSGGLGSTAHNVPGNLRHHWVVVAADDIYLVGNVAQEIPSNYVIIKVKCVCPKTGNRQNGNMCDGGFKLMPARRVS